MAYNSIRCVRRIQQTSGETVWGIKVGIGVAVDPGARACPRQETNTEAKRKRLWNAPDHDHEQL